MSVESESLMEVRDLEVQFSSRGEVARAVDGVSIEWRRGEILGIVGESGCGKSTLARAMLALVEPAAGEVVLNGDPVGDKSSLAELRERVQMIFQDPYQTLNPRQRVRTIVAEPLRVQGVRRRRPRRRVRSGARGRRARARALPRALPAPALRRPAPAGRDRGGAGARARRADLRRAGLDARRLGPRADPRRAARASAPPGAGADLHHPRPQPGLVAVRPDRGHVPGAGGRAGVGGRRDRAPAPPLHAGAGHRDPGARGGRRRGSASCSAASCPDPTDIPTGCRFHPRCPKRFEPCDSVDPSLIAVGGRDQMAACLLHDPTLGRPRRRGDLAGDWRALARDRRRRSDGSSPARATRSPTCPGSASATRRRRAASRTGVTVVAPPSLPAPAATAVVNGMGELTGKIEIDERGRDRRRRSTSAGRTRSASSTTPRCSPPGAGPRGSCCRWSASATTAGGPTRAR